jgi:hypothetical protein
MKSHALFRTAPALARATSVTQSAAIGDVPPGQSASSVAEDRDVIDLGSYGQADQDQHVGRARITTAARGEPNPDSQRQIRRYACVPGLSTGRLRLPPVFTGLAARAPARCELRGGAPPIQPSAVARTGHRQCQSLGWATWRPAPGQVPCAAPGFSRGAAARRQARGAAPRRNLRLSGVAHQRAQRRTDTIGSARRARAPSPPSANAQPLVGRLGSWEWIGPPGRPAAGPLANAATVTGRNGPPGGPGGDQVARVTGPMRRGFAQVTG